MGVRGPWDRVWELFKLLEVMHYIFGIIFNDLFRFKDLLEIYDFEELL